MGVEEKEMIQIGERTAREAVTPSSYLGKVPASVEKVRR